MRKLFVLTSVIALLLAVVLSPTPTINAQDGGDEDPGTIADIVVASAEGENPEFTTLLAALQAAELTNALSVGGPFTVFAPSDEAFAATLEELGLSAEDVLGDAELLTSILLYHVVPGTFTAEDLSEYYVDESLATAYWGSTIDVTASEEGGVMIDDANVVTADIAASNGVIHVIDSVLLPDEDEGSLATAEGFEAESAIVEIALATPEFSTLVEAVLAAPEATEYVTAGVPFTVFAPTNDGFTATLDALGMELGDIVGDPEMLNGILAYHIVPFPFAATDITALDGAYLGTLLPGEALYVEVDDDGNVFINDAQVTMADIVGIDGVAHAIDFVLVPGMGDDMDDMDGDDMDSDDMDSDDMDGDDMDDDDMDDDDMDDDSMDDDDMDDDDMDDDSAE